MDKQEKGSNFYMLTAQIINDKNLNHAEKLTMAILNGLSHEDGSCYPSNEWIAEKLDIKERAVKDILQNLEKNNYIKREIISCSSNPFKKYRIIYINTNSKLCLPGAENCPIGRAENCPIDGQKTAHIIDKKELIDKKEKKESGLKAAKEKSASPPPPPFFCHKRVKMSEEKLKKLQEEYGKERVDEMIERLDEYADLNPKRFKQYACHAAVIRKWIRDDKMKTSYNGNTSKNASNATRIDSFGLEGDHRSWIKTVALKHHEIVKKGLMRGAGEYLEFTLRDGNKLKIYYRDAKFKELVLNQLRKMGRDVLGL